jgi:hypothetical protein
MTYDQLYNNVLHYIDLSLEDERKACLILGAFMDFILDCADDGIDPRTLDMTGFVNEKLDELDGLV